MGVDYHFLLQGQLSKEPLKVKISQNSSILFKIVKLTFLCPRLWRSLPLLISYPWKLSVMFFRSPGTNCLPLRLLLVRACSVFAMRWTGPARLPLRSGLQPPPPPPHLPNSQIWFYDFASISHGESILSTDAVYYKISYLDFSCSLCHCHWKILN